IFQVIQQSGLQVNAADKITPALFSPAWLISNITVESARSVFIVDENNRVLGSGYSTNPYPADLLASLSDRRLFPGDSLLWNGEELNPYTALPPASAYTLVYKPAYKITLIKDGQVVYLSASRPSLGQALWDAGYRLTSADSLSLPLNTPLRGDLTVLLTSAAPLSIQQGQATYVVKTSAQTVGDVLAGAGLALENGDFSTPAEDQPLPPDRIIQVTRVSESILLEQKVLPFESELVSSDQVNLDERQVIEAGALGLQVSRTRVRYENGVETNRTVESDWTAAEPKKQTVGYGTRPNIRTIDSPSGPLEYYRSVTVYATSYSPCRSGASRCYNSTSSGLPVQRGVIGVTRQWYNLFAGQRVYIPGYGVAVIADVGGGIPGQRWIDLGFSDDDYESWHQNVTMYFLTPVPATIPWTLP
ncbi:MAG: G5 domain-containing protein, partial [Anaerolineae bacterium]|nr:G5 domain-containing protein [Anaerolineae bacterium]